MLIHRNHWAQWIRMESMGSTAPGAHGPGPGTRALCYGHQISAKKGHGRYLVANQPHTHTAIPGAWAQAQVHGGGNPSTSTATPPASQKMFK